MVRRFFFFFSSRRRHTRWPRDWSSDVCSSDLIQGTEGTVKGLSRRRLLGYFRDNYVPRNILIVAAGNLSHARIAKMAASTFGRMSPGGRPTPEVSRPRPRGGIVTRAKKELEQLHLLMGVPAFPE